MGIRVVDRDTGVMWELDEIRLSDGCQKYIPLEELEVWTPIWICGKDRNFTAKVGDIGQVAYRTDGYSGRYIFRP